MPSKEIQDLFLHPLKMVSFVRTCDKIYVYQEPPCDSNKNKNRTKKKKSKGKQVDHKYETAKFDLPPARATPVTHPHQVAGIERNVDRNLVTPESKVERSHKWPASRDVRKGNQQRLHVKNHQSTPVMKSDEFDLLSSLLNQKSTSSIDYNRTEQQVVKKDDNFETDAENKDETGFKSIRHERREQQKEGCSVKQEKRAPLVKKKNNTMTYSEVDSGTFDRTNRSTGELLDSGVNNEIEASLKHTSPNAESSIFHENITNRLLPGIQMNPASGTNSPEPLPPGVEMNDVSRSNSPENLSPVQLNVSNKNYSPEPLPPGVEINDDSRSNSPEPLPPGVEISSKSNSPEPLPSGVELTGSRSNIPFPPGVELSPDIGHNAKTKFSFVASAMRSINSNMQKIVSTGETLTRWRERQRMPVQFPHITPKPSEFVDREQPVPPGEESFQVTTNNRMLELVGKTTPIDISVASRVCVKRKAESFADIPKRKKPKKRNQSKSEEYRRKREIEIEQQNEMKRLDKLKTMSVLPKERRMQLRMGDDCRFSHDIEVQKRLECCKFYIAGACLKGDKCIFFHSEWPCKFFHMWNACTSGNECKFSHAEISRPDIKEAFEARIKFEESLKTVGGPVESREPDSEIRSTDTQPQVSSAPIEPRPQMSSAPAEPRLQVSSEMQADKENRETHKEEEAFQFPTLYQDLS